MKGDADQFAGKLIRFGREGDFNDWTTSGGLCEASRGGVIVARIVGYGVHGDPLQEGKLDLPEMLEVPSPDEWAWARDFVARRRWQEAVTYREKAPHEYTVRRWIGGSEANRDFDEYVTYIRRFGHADFYYELRHIYWVADEFKYWTMGWPVEETTVVNRARLDTPEPWKKRAGWHTR